MRCCVVMIVSSMALISCGSRPDERPGQTEKRPPPDVGATTTPGNSNAVSPTTSLPKVVTTTIQGAATVLGVPTTTTLPTSTTLTTVSSLTTALPTSTTLTTVSSLTTTLPTSTTLTTVSSLPTTTQTVTTTTIPAASEASVWIASQGNSSIAGYDKNGNYIGFIDLSAYVGAETTVSSISWLNENTMVVMADPGAGDEKILRLDFKDNTPVTINANWYQDSVNLSNVSVFKMVNWSDNKLLVMKNASSFEGLAYNLAANLVTRIGNPFVAAGLGGKATCDLGTVQYAIPVTRQKKAKLLVLSRGAYTRMNIYGDIDTSPTCDSSWDYVTKTVTANHIPTGVAQTKNGKVYVRYQHSENPVIVRYEFDGDDIGKPKDFYNDTNFLNQGTQDRDLVTLDSHQLLFANWAKSSVVRLDIDSETADTFIHDLFTAKVTAIGIRP